ncbi:MAG: hypothetical protein KDA92_09990 [Planctomycetales bacterium]|nr:hypothetical protein [Planctomycetales bacterium]
MDDPPAVNIRQDTWPAWTWLVIGVAGLLLLAAYNQWLTSHSLAMRAWFDARPWAVWLFAALAALVSFVVGSVATRHLSATLVIPLTGLVGAIVTASARAEFGAIIGSMVGASVVYARNRAPMHSLGAQFVMRAFPVTLLGLAAGFISTNCYYENRQSVSIGWVAVALVLLAAIWIAIRAIPLGRWGRELKPRTRLGGLGWLAAAVPLLGLTMFVGFQLNIAYRVWRINQVGVASYEYVLSPFHRWLNYPAIVSARLDETATDADLLLLRAAPRLRWFHIEGSQITDDAFLQLDLSQLTALTLRCPLTNRAIAGLIASPGLEVIELDGTQASRASVQTFAQLPALRYLIVGHLIDDGSTLAPLASIRTLSSLELRDCQLDDDDIASVANPSLTHLSLRNNQITGPGIAALSKCRFLDQLDLIGNPLDGTYLQHLGNAPLVYLYLDDTNLPNAGISALSQQNGVRELSLRRVTANASHLAAALSQLSLSELHIDEQVIFARPWQPVKPPEFLHVHVYDRELDAADMVRFMSLEADVHLHRCRLTPDAVAMAKCTVHQFILHDCPIDSRFRAILGHSVIWGR